MTAAPHPGQIRSLVLSTLQGLGAGAFSAEQLEETLLVQEGRCVARSYRTSDHFAMWMLELGLLQFYNANGDILLVVNLLEEASTGRMAA